MEQVEKLGMDDCVQIEHYLALKGRNDLLEYSVAYFTHLFQLPINAYRSKGVALGDSIDGTFTSKFKDQYNFGFSDLRLEAIRFLDILAGFYQDVYRLAIRENRPVDVYLGLNNKAMINIMCRTWPNIKPVWEDF